MDSSLQTKYLEGLRLSKRWQPKELIIRSPRSQQLTDNDILKKLIEKNDVESVKAFLMEYKHIIFHDDHFPLRYACRHGDSHISIIELLLSHKCSATACDNEAVIDAASRGHYHVVVVLGNNGANPKDQNYLAYFAAAYHGHLNILKYFVDKWGNPNKVGAGKIMANLPNNIDHEEVRKLIY